MSAASLKPSEFKRERMLSMQSYLDSQLNFDNNKSARKNVPRIVEVLMRPDGPIKDSQVPLDKPLFEPWPPQVILQGYEPFQTYEIPLKFRNVDKVARRIKLECIDHPFFKVEGVRQKSNLSSGRVAPGTETSFLLVFSPEETIDYRCEISCVTDREKFALDVVARGARGILDFPDSVVFNSPLLKFKNEKVLFVRNLGNKATKFSLTTSDPDVFQIEPTSCYLEEGRNMQLTCTFVPKDLLPATGKLYATYDSGEVLEIELEGQAREAKLKISQSAMDMGNVSVSLLSAGTVLIENRDKNNVFSFRWCQFACTQDENLYIKRKQLALQTEWDAERAALPQPPTHESLLLLQKRYENRFKEVELNASPLFSHSKFRLEPLEGKVWPRSSVSCQVYFAPDESMTFSATAFCDLEGRAQRLPLQLQGTGVGPKAHLNYSHLMLGDVIVHSHHQYEVQLENDGDIPFFFDISPASKHSKEALDVEFDPKQGTVIVGESKRILVKVNPKFVRTVENVRYVFQLEHSHFNLPFELSGQVVPPSILFDVEKLDFGHISYGFPTERSFKLKNLSNVPINVSLEPVNHEKQPFNMSEEEYRFEPQNVLLKSSEEREIKVCLTPKSVAYYENYISVNVADVAEGLYYLPVSALSVVADLFVVTPEINIGKAYINHTYEAQVVIRNQSQFAAHYRIALSGEHAHPEVLLTFPHPKGEIAAESDCVIPLNVQVERLGKFEVAICIYVGNDTTPPLKTTLIAEGIGPSVDCSTSAINFDKIPVLISHTVNVVLQNNSPIPAVYLAKLAGVFAASAHGPYSIEPTDAVIPPFASLTVKVTAFLNDTVKFTEILQLVIKSSSTFEIPLNAKGTGSTILFDCDLHDVDFQYLMTHRPSIKNVTLTNKGKRAHSICWVNSVEEDGPPLFEIIPSRFVLRTNQSQVCAIRASSSTACTAKQRWSCLSVIAKDPIRRLIYESVFRAKFINPSIQAFPPRLLFGANELFHSLVLKNSCPLPYEIALKCPPGISVDSVSSKSAHFLEPGSEVKLNVTCDESNRKTLQSLEMTENLTISFVNHVTKAFVPIQTSVIFPNLSIDADVVTFEGTEPGTISEYCFNITPKSASRLNYSWGLVRETFQFEPIDGAEAPELNFESLDLFDIRPFAGSLVAGEKEVVKVFFKPSKSLSKEYYGSYKVSAICSVENGPQYEVVIEAFVDKLAYDIEPTTLDYGTRLSQAITDKSFTIVNFGKVGINYQVTMDPAGSLLRKALVFPASGLLKVGERQEVTVRFCALAPEITEEPLYLHLGNNKPIPITVRASGTISRYSLNSNSDKLEIARASVQKAINENFEELFQSFYSKALPVGANIVQNSNNALGSPLLLYRYMANSSSIKDLLNSSLALNSTNLHLLMQNLKPKREKRAQVLLTSLVELGEIVAPEPFEINFGHVTKSALVKRTVKIVNTQSQGLAFAFDVGFLQKHGITAEPDRGRLCPSSTQASAAGLKDWCNITLSFKAVGKISQSASKDGSFVLDLPMYVANGLTQPFRLKGQVSMPEAVISSGALNFEQVLVGTRKTLFLQLKNTQSVPSEYQFNIASAEDLQRPQSTASASPHPGSARLADLDKVPLEKQVARKSVSTAKTPAVTVATAEKGRHEKSRKPAAIKFEQNFNILPSSGVLEPFETKLIAVSFAPEEERAIQCQVPFKVQYNGKVQSLILSGDGVLPRVEVFPKKLNLGPCLPFSDPAEARFTIRNCVQFPLEVVAYDFDTLSLNDFVAIKEKLRDGHRFAVAPLHEPGKQLSFYNSKEATPDRAPEVLEEKPSSCCFILHGPPYAGVSTLAKQLSKRLHISGANIDQILESHFPTLSLSHSHAVPPLNAPTFDAGDAGTAANKLDNRLVHLSSHSLRSLPENGASLTADPGVVEAGVVESNCGATGDTGRNVAPNVPQLAEMDSDMLQTAAPATLFTEEMVFEALVARLEGNSSGFVIDGLESRLFPQPLALIRLLQKASFQARLKVVFVNLVSKLETLQLHEQKSMQLDPIPVVLGSQTVELDGLSEDDFDRLSDSQKKHFEEVLFKNRAQRQALQRRRLLARQRWDDQQALQKNIQVVRDEDKRKGSIACNAATANTKGENARLKAGKLASQAAAQTAAKDISAKIGGRVGTSSSITIVNQQSTSTPGSRSGSGKRGSARSADRSRAKSSSIKTALFDLEIPQSEALFLKESTYKRLESYNASITAVKAFINDAVSSWNKLPSLSQSLALGTTPLAASLNSATNLGASANVAVGATKEDKVQKRAGDKAAKPEKTAGLAPPPVNGSSFSSGGLNAHHPTAAEQASEHGKSTPADESGAAVQGAFASTALIPLWLELESLEHGDCDNVWLNRISSVPGLELLFGRPETKMPSPIVEQLYHLPDGKLFDFVKRVGTTASVNHFSISPIADAEGRPSEAADGASSGGSATGAAVSSANAAGALDSAPLAHGAPTKTGGRKGKGAGNANAVLPPVPDVSVTLESGQLVNAVSNEDPTAALNVYRYVVPASGSTDICVKFASSDVGEKKQALKFGLVGFPHVEPVVVECKGEAAYACINAAPERLYGGRCVETREELPQGIAHGHFIKSENVFDIGPLLFSPVTAAGQTGLQNKSKENKEQKEVRKWLLYVTNPNPYDEKVQVGFLKDAKNEVFQVEPSSYDLQPNETVALAVSVTLKSVGVFDDHLILSVRDNPEPYIVKVTCQGVKPELALDRRAFAFERQLLSKIETREIRLKNSSQLAVCFKWQGVDLLGEEFSLEPGEGVIQPEREVVTKVTFCSNKPVVVKKSLKLEVFELNADGVTNGVLLQSESVSVTAEAYDISVELHLPKGPDGIDFGTCRVSDECRQVINLKNKGKYDIGFNTAVVDGPGSFLRDSLIFVPAQATVPASEKLFPVTVIFKPSRELAFPGEEHLLKFQIFEPLTDEVACTFPIKVAGKSVYSKFTILPFHELEFGSLMLGVKLSKSIVVENTGEFDFRFGFTKPQNVSETAANLQQLNKKSGAGPSLAKMVKLHLMPQNSSSNSLPAPAAAEKSAVHSVESAPTEPPSTLSALTNSSRAPVSTVTLNQSPANLKSVPAPSVPTKSAPVPIENLTSIFGPFTVQPSSGVVPANSKVIVNVDFHPDTAGVYSEPLCIEVSDKSPLDFPEKAIEYRLTGESCVPLVDTNFSKIFEEHAIVSRLDAIGDFQRRCVFVESESLFHFGPRLIGQVTTARIKLYNPTKVSCELSFLIKQKSINGGSGGLPQPGSKHAASVTTSTTSSGQQSGVQQQQQPQQTSQPSQTQQTIFDIEPKQLLIQSYEQTFVTLKFAPTVIGTFSAHFEAMVVFNENGCSTLTGTQALHNSGLAFEIRGEGTLPRITMSPQSSKALVNGSSTGGKYPKQGNSVSTMSSNMIFRFGKVFLNQTVSEEIILRNDSLVDARFSVELVQNDGTKFFDLMDANPTVIYVLEPNCSKVIHVLFKPTAAKRSESDLRLKLVDNPFEDMTLSLCGEGYVQDVTLEASKYLDDYLNDSGSTTINFGDCAVGEFNKIALKAFNRSSVTQRVVWDVTAENLKTFNVELSKSTSGNPSGQSLIVFSPTTAHILPNSWKQLFILFKPIAPMEVNQLPIRFCFQKIQCDAVRTAGVGEEGWDDSLKVIKYDPSGQKVMEWLAEPSYALTGSPASLQQLFINAHADYAAYECDTERIVFKSTMMFQSRIYAITIKNTGQVALSCTGMSWSCNSEPFSVDASEGWELEPGQSKVLNVKFSPVEPLQYQNQLQIAFANLASGVAPLTVNVLGASQRPFCHFELDSSTLATVDFSTLNSFSDENGQSLLLDRASTRVVEINCIGIGGGTRIQKTFYCLNPTMQAFQFEWVRCVNANSKQSSIRCETVTGSISPGRKTEMVFTFSPEASGIVQTLYQFCIREHKISVNFLFVGKAREPVLTLDPPIIYFKHVPVSRTATETFTLHNRELLPFNFSINLGSLHFKLLLDLKKGSDSIRSSSNLLYCGTIASQESLSFTLQYSPTEECAQQQSNLVVQVKRKPAPLTLPIISDAYEIHDLLTLELFNGVGASLQSSSTIALDCNALSSLPANQGTGSLSKVITFQSTKAAAAAQQAGSKAFYPGTNVPTGNIVEFGKREINDQRFVPLTLANNGRFQFEYAWTISSFSNGSASGPALFRSSARPGTQSSSTASQSCPFKVEPASGVLGRGEKVACNVSFVPLLDSEFSCIAQCKVTGGKTYRLLISGAGKKPPVKFSVQKLSFSSALLFFSHLFEKSYTQTFHIVNHDSRTVSVECSVLLAVSDKSVSQVQNSVVVEPSGLITILPGKSAEFQLIVTPRETGSFQCKVVADVNGLNKIYLPCQFDAELFRVDAVLKQSSSAFGSTPSGGGGTFNVCVSTVAPHLLKSLQPSQNAQWLADGAKAKFIRFSPLRIGATATKTIRLYNRCNQLSVAFQFGTAQQLATLSKQYGISFFLPTSSSQNLTNAQFSGKRVISHENYGLELASFQTNSDINLPPKGSCKLTCVFTPQTSLNPFQHSLSIVHKPTNFNFPLCTVSGSAQSVQVALDTQLVNFGSIVQNSSIVKRTKLWNSGDVTVKFCWDMALVAKSGFPVTVQPIEGILGPNSDLPIEFTFIPSLAPRDFRLEKLRCNIDDSDALEVSLVGQSVTPPPPKEALLFKAPVRSFETKSVSITNKSWTPWRLRPTVDRDDYWSGADLLEVEPGQTRAYEITFKPMSSAAEQVRGTLFFGLPDGQALVFGLQGQVESPLPFTTLSLEHHVSSKPHSLTLPVANWLGRSQRFGTKLEMSPPVGLSAKLLVESFTVPALQSKDIPIEIYGFKEGSYTVKVIFYVETRPAEYVCALINVRVLSSQEVCTLELTTAVRQPLLHSLQVSNPLDSPVKFTCSQTVVSPDLVIHTPTVTVQPKSVGSVVLEFAPLIAKVQVAKVCVACPDLGSENYDLTLKATAGVPERPIHFSAPLGSSQTITVKFASFAKNGKVDYTTRMLDSQDFTADKQFVLSTAASKGEQVSVGSGLGSTPQLYGAPSASSNATGTGSTVSHSQPTSTDCYFDVVYEPTSVGSSKAQLVLTSATAGEHVFPLFGTCTVPNPQGPILVKPGLTTQLPFKNVFMHESALTYQIDNPLFTVRAPEKVGGKKAITIAIGFSGPAVAPSGHEDSTITLPKRQTSAVASVSAAGSSGNATAPSGVSAASSGGDGTGASINQSQALTSSNASLGNTQTQNQIGGSTANIPISGKPNMRTSPSTVSIESGGQSAANRNAKLVVTNQMTNTSWIFYLRGG